MAKNILFSFKKVEKHTILAGGWGGQRRPNKFDIAGSVIAY